MRLLLLLLPGGGCPAPCLPAWLRCRPGCKRAAATIHPPTCRGPTAQLEMLATQLQGRLGGIQADKTDVAAILACAMLLQDEAAAGLGPAPAAAAAADGATAAGDGKASNGPLLAWARDVCEGAAAAAAPQPAGAVAPADAEAAAEALHWARFAAAAYGEQQHGWRRGKASARAASKQLSALAAAAKAEGARPLAGWGGLGAAANVAAAGAGGGARSSPSKAQLRDLAAARDLLGPACQIVALSHGDSEARLPPHLLAVDRCAWMGGCGLEMCIVCWALLHAVRGCSEDVPHNAAVHALSAERSVRWCWALAATCSSRTWPQTWPLCRPAGWPAAPLRQRSTAAWMAASQAAWAAAGPTPAA